MKQGADQRFADHDRVIQSSRNLSASGIGISGDAELSKRSPDVEVGPLADHAFVLELKNDD